MRLERHWENGTPVVVLRRGKKPVEPVQQFGKVGTGGQLQFWQARLRKVREERGFSQETVAFRSGLSVSGYRKLETGLRANARLSTLERVAFVLGVQVRDLL